VSYGQDNRRPTRDAGGRTYTAALTAGARPPRILVSSGEPSGELYGALLLRELKKHRPPFASFGLGGDAMAGEGVSLVAHVRDLAVVGLLEVVRHLPRLRRVFRAVLAEVDRDPPQLAVLIDYAGFHLRLARELQRRGIPVVYYVSPQVWAWRSGRLRTIRETVSRMLVLFPFEPAVYEAAGVPVTFVGHPLVDRLQPAPDRGTARTTLGLDPQRRLVALLPGSRPQEVRYNLPPLLGAVDILVQRHPDLQLALAAAPGLDAAALRLAIGTRPVRVLEGRATALLAAADLGLVASGTATVEAALVDTPIVVVYRLSPVTYALGRRFVNVPHYAMVNLIAEQRLVPEVIQHEMTPERVAAEALRLLNDPASMHVIQEGLAVVRARLGGPGASARAAMAVASEWAALADKNVDRVPTSV
jgi:lipid-A-disaccharide synthase